MMVMQKHQEEDKACRTTQELIAIREVQKAETTTLVSRLMGLLSEGKKKKPTLKKRAS